MRSRPFVLRLLLPAFVLAVSLLGATGGEWRALTPRYPPVLGRPELRAPPSCTIVGNFPQSIPQGGQATVAIAGRCFVSVRDGDGTEYQWLSDRPGIYSFAQVPHLLVEEARGDGFTVTHADAGSFTIRVESDAGDLSTPRAITFSAAREERAATVRKIFRIVPAENASAAEGFCCTDRGNACRAAADVPGADGPEENCQLHSGRWVPVGPGEDPAARKDVCDYTVCRARGACCVPGRDACLWLPRRECLATAAAAGSPRAQFYGSDTAGCEADRAAYQCGVAPKTYCRSRQPAFAEDAAGGYGRCDVVSAGAPPVGTGDYDTLGEERAAAGRPTGYSCGDYCGYFYCMYHLVMREDGSGLFTPGCINAPITAPTGLVSSCIDDLPRLGQGFLETPADGSQGRILHPPFCKAMPSHAVARLSRTLVVRELVPRLWGVPITYDAALNARDAVGNPLQFPDGAFATPQACSRFCRVPPVPQRR